MIQRGITDFVTLTTAATAGSRHTYTVKQQRRRLEGFVVQVVNTTTGAMTGAYSTPYESFGRLLKRARVRVNDVAGSRFAVDVEGIAAIEEWTHFGGGLPHATWFALGNTGSAAATYRVTYPIFLRHPQLEDPSGVLTSIPLYDLREDLTLELEMCAAADIGGTPNLGASSTIRVGTLYRDTDKGDYIPGEWISVDRDTLPASSSVDVEIPSNGLLTSVLIQNYTAAEKRVRGTIIGSSGDPAVTLQYGRDVVARIHPDLQHDYGYLTASENPAASSSTVMGVSRLDHGFLIDLMDDRPVVGAFSANSGLNLTSIRAGGDVAKLNISSTSATAPCVRMTTRKFLGGPINLLFAA